MNNIIKFLLSIFNKVIDFLTPISSSISDFAISNYNAIADFIIAISSQDLSLELIAGEIALLALYFVFFPLIVDRHSKDYYLGYNVSHWILYERKKFLKIHNISLHWVLSIFAVVISIIAYGKGNYAVVTLVFAIFIFILLFKVIEYLRLTSNENIIHKSMEKRFIKDSAKDSKVIYTKIIDNVSDDNNEFRKTINFILTNYEKQGISNVFDNVYYFTMSNIDNMKQHIMFEEIMYKINNTKCNFKFNISPWDLYYYIKNNLKDTNEKDVIPIMKSIIANSLTLGLDNEEYYTEILPILFRAINENNMITDDLKKRTLESIVKEITYLKYRKKNEAETEEVRFKYITSFTKFLIDGNYDYYLEMIYEIFEDNKHDKTFYDISVTLMTYLYYVIEIEIPAYVNEETKERYKKIYQKFSKFLDKDNEYIIWENTDYTKKLFAKIKKIYRQWEIFKDGKIKTPLADKSVEIANKSILVYSRINNYSREESMGEYDLTIFKYSFENSQIKKEIINDINSYLKFLNLEVSEEEINAYSDRLNEIAKIEYKFLKKISNEDFENGKENITTVKDDLIKKLNKYSIFNNKETEKQIEIPIRYIFEKQTIPHLVNNINFYNGEFLKSIIGEIQRNISKEIKDVIEYTYNNTKPILDKLNRLKGKYYYVCYEKDNLGEQWNLGEKYLNAKKKYTVATTPFSRKNLIIKDYACSLNKIDINIEELNNEEIDNYMKRIINNRKYIINEFGYNIPYSRKEIIEYIKMTYFVLSINVVIKFEVIDNRGCIFKYIIPKKEHKK